MVKIKCECGFETYVGPGRQAEFMKDVHERECGDRPVNDEYKYQ